MLGGLEQCLLVRGSPARPLLLFLHGGPGVAEMCVSSYMRALERHFLVVYWDQRGAGRSFRPDIPRSEMSLEHLVADTRELSEGLLERFGQEKLLLVGHSWGGALGILTARRYPELFQAVVGINPVVHGRENETRFYRYALLQAEQLGRWATLSRLQRLGEPLHREAYSGLLMRWWWLLRLGSLFHHPEALAEAIWTGVRFYKPSEIPRYFRGLFFSLESLWPCKLGIDLFRSAPELRVPLYLFSGRFDQVTPTELIQAYFGEVDAPQKELVWFEHSAHCPHLEEPEGFAEALARRCLDVQKWHYRTKAERRSV